MCIRDSNRAAYLLQQRVGGTRDRFRGQHLFTMMFLETIRIAHMKKVLWNATALAVIGLLVSVAFLSVRIERQSTREEAQPADVILVLGAAEYRGRPSPVLRARLDHALELYNRRLAPRILTTGGPGGDPEFTEGGVGSTYLKSSGEPREDNN